MEPSATHPVPCSQGMEVQLGVLPSFREKNDELMKTRMATDEDPAQTLSRSHRAKRRDGAEERVMEQGSMDKEGTEEVEVGESEGERGEEEVAEPRRKGKIRAAGKGDGKEDEEQEGRTTMQVQQREIPVVGSPTKGLCCQGMYMRVTWREKKGHTKG